MDTKNLCIGVLSLSALLMACSLLIVENTRQSRAEESIISSRDSAFLSAASVRAGAQQEVLVLVDRTTHIMRVYLFQNGLRPEELVGSPVNLAQAMNTNPSNTRPR